MNRCPWSGQEFEPVQRGPNEKVFANSAARAGAHKACRNYTEWLISRGHLTWEMLRGWSDRQERDGASYTSRPTPPDPQQQPLPGFDKEDAL